MSATKAEEGGRPEEWHRRPSSQEVDDGVRDACEYDPIVGTLEDQSGLSNFRFVLKNPLSGFPPKGSDARGCQGLQPEEPLRGLLGNSEPT